MNPTPPSVIEATLLADAGPLAAGALLVAAGVLTMALYVLRRERQQLFLIAFGLFSLLHGLRLWTETVTLHLLLGVSRETMTQLRMWLSYPMPAAAFFSFEQFLGPGWLASQRRVWQTFVVFAVAAVAADAATGVVGYAMPANNVLVVLGVLVTFTNAWRRDLLATPGVRVFLGGFAIFGLLAVNANLVGLGWLPWRVDLEVVGFLILVCSLAWAGAQRFLANERQLVSIEGELETARRIQTSILPRRMPEIDGLRVAARYRPMSSVAGDFYDFLEVDDRRLGGRALGRRAAVGGDRRSRRAGPRRSGRRAAGGPCAVDRRRSRRGPRRRLDAAGDRARRAGRKRSGASRADGPPGGVVPVCGARTRARAEDYPQGLDERPRSTRSLSADERSSRERS